MPNTSTWREPHRTQIYGKPHNTPLDPSQQLVVARAVGRWQDETKCKIAFTTWKVYALLKCNINCRQLRRPLATCVASSNLQLATRFVIKSRSAPKNHYKVLFPQFVWFKTNCSQSVSQSFTHLAHLSLSYKMFPVQKFWSSSCCFFDGTQKVATSCKRLKTNAICSCPTPEENAAAIAT